jgi:adenylate cyclase class 2
MNAVISETVIQVDVYYSHPSRDFASTDEALRIRRIGDKNFLTYKGPKIDTTTKTRREIEVSVAQGEEGAANLRVLLDALGFRKVAQVRKRRREFSVSGEGGGVTGALDEVDRLGSFVELEIVADGEHVEEAKNRLEKLARQLELTTSERRSYLELLLEREE